MLEAITEYNRLVKAKYLLRYSVAERRNVDISILETDDPEELTFSFNHPEDGLDESSLYYIWDKTHEVYRLKYTWDKSLTDVPNKIATDKDVREVVKLVAAGDFAKRQG